MRFCHKLGVLSCVLAFAAVQQASAAVVLTFSAAELDAMVVVTSSDTYDIGGPGNPPASAMTIAPTFSDGTTPMSGAAGATGTWPDALSGASVDVFLGTVFLPGTHDLSGFDTLAVVAFNDNDDIWSYDVWIETVVDGLVASTPVAITGGGSSATITLDISALDLTDVTGIGVSVHGLLSNTGGNPSAGDAHHSSFTGVPEPSTVAVWSLLGLGAAVVARRRMKKA